MERNESRYAEVSRRAFLKRTAAFGVAAAFGLAACTDDAETFATASTTAAAETTATSSAVATSTAAVEATTATTGATTTTAAAGGSVISAGSELAVSFTYRASSTGGQVRNPYVAVWIEDADGDLVDTIAVWFLQSQKGLRWISELKRWYAVDGSNSSLSTVSSATRSPGDYSVVWDVTDTDDSQVAAGDYYVCIEAAREHGPYSLIREVIPLGDQSFAQDLTDDKELSNAAVQLTIV